MKRPNAARLAAACLALSAAGCGRSGKPGFEYMPDMARSLPYDSFAPNPVSRDGKTLQPPVAGTVARGALPLHYQPTPEDAERAGRELDPPIPVTLENVSRGKGLYETFCYVCHGERGAGDGPLVPKIPNPPAYSSERVRQMRPGQIFHVITWGSGRMPSYASQIAANDRWLIVRYVEVLRAAEGARP